MNLEVSISPSSGELRYCCCDNDLTCSVDRSEVALTSCENACDVFFNADLLEGCDASSQCFFSTAAGLLQDTNPKSDFGYIFTFNLGVIPNEVK